MSKYNTQWAYLKLIQEMRSGRCFQKRKTFMGVSYNCSMMKTKV